MYDLHHAYEKVPALRVDEVCVGATRRALDVTTYLGA